MKFLHDRQNRVDQHGDHEDHQTDDGRNELPIHIRVDTCHYVGSRERQ